MHDVENCQADDCFACKIRSIQFSPYATPSRLHPEHRPRREANSFNKGVIRDASGAPIHRDDGSVIGFHELTGNRSAIEREIRDKAEAGRAGRPVNAPRDTARLSTKE